MYKVYAALSIQEVHCHIVQSAPAIHIFSSDLRNSFSFVKSAFFAFNL